VHYAEWDNSAMTTGSFLPAVSATPLFLGTYSASNPFPNPMKTPSTGTFAGFSFSPAVFR